MLQRVIYAIDQLSKTVGHAFAWCIVMLMVGTSYEVFMRYVLDSPTSWAFDWSYIMYGALFYMAGAYTLANVLLSRRGARHRKRSGSNPHASQQGADQGSGLAIAIGALLDGIPESVVIVTSRTKPTASCLLKSTSCTSWWRSFGQYMPRLRVRIMGSFPCNSERLRGLSVWSGSS